MRKIEKYYDNTEINLPHKNIKKFTEIEANTGNAIDLGCGAGRDTIYLVKKGWNVLAIDRENVELRISEKLNGEELKHFKFSQQKFENIKLENNNLLVANFSIPFCNKNNFQELWNKISDSIVQNGYFVGNLFGIKDEWENIKEDMTFLAKEEVFALFNEFEIISFKEIEEDGITVLGKQKHWHIFDVIARKK